MSKQSLSQTEFVSLCMAISNNTSNMLRIKKLHEDAKIPTKAHIGDLGLDLYALENVHLQSGHVTKVRTGIACEFPAGYGGIIRGRSSVETKQEVFVVAGVIDNGYTGEIIVAFYNPGEPSLVRKDAHSYDIVNFGHKRFEKGDKIAQLILTPVVECDIIEVTSLSETTRNDGGFGSSGS